MGDNSDNKSGEHGSTARPALVAFRQQGNDTSTPSGSSHVPMWFKPLPDDGSWASLWSGYVRCACGGIRTTKGQCPSCGERLNLEWTVLQDSDRTGYRVPPAFNGGEGRYKDWGLPQNARMRMGQAHHRRRPIPLNLRGVPPLSSSDRNPCILDLLRNAYRKTFP